MFGTVDESRDHSIITVKHAVKIMPLRRAPLAPGVYKIQGDVRSKLGHSTVQRHLSAGIFHVEFVPGDADQKVSARTLSEFQSPNEVANPMEAGAQSAPDTNLPGLNEAGKTPEGAVDNSGMLPQDNNLTVMEPETITNQAVDGEAPPTEDLGDLSEPSPVLDAGLGDLSDVGDELDDLPEVGPDAEVAPEEPEPSAEAEAEAAPEEPEPPIQEDAPATSKKRRRRKRSEVDL